jgi:hypothetical protein
MCFGTRFPQSTFLAYFSHFEKIKIKVALSDHNAVCVSVYPLFQFLMPEPFFIKLGMHIMPPEPISTVYFINPSHLSVYVSVSPYRC